MATTNARIQFSTADEETWKSVNPTLREGELVITKKPSGKYRLYVGATGGSKFNDSTVVWDEELADSHEKNAAISAANAMTSKSAAASSASAAEQSMNSAKGSASAAEQSMSAAEASAVQAAEYMNNAINSSNVAAQNSTSAASSMKKAEQSMNSAKESADKAIAASNNASSSAASAANSESNAIDAKNKATQSASEAKSSELNAKASEKSAADSAAALSYATQEEVNSGIEIRKIVSPQTLGTLLNLRLKAMIDILYPVGIVVTTATDDALKPGEADGLATWEEIAQDRILQGASSGAGVTIEAGLPNITGYIVGYGDRTGFGGAGGMAYLSDEQERIPSMGDIFPGNKSSLKVVFDASKSNNIYGNSSTVQPPAYKVHFWKRIK